MSSAAGTNNEPEAGGSEPEPHNDSRFECNICLDIAKDAVISMCGHLFCWPCLHQWLETRPNRQLCPVCKSSISKDKVIPLYGRGGDNSDPREKVPPRPQGQRTEAPQNGFPGFNWGGNGDGGFQFSFGIGAFPFTLFATTLNFGDRRPSAPAPGTTQYEEERYLSNIFLILAVLFIVWLILA